MKTAAQIISSVFHPLFYPIYLLVITLFLPVYNMQRYNIEFKYFIIGYVALANVIIPILSLWIMKKYGLISNFTINQRQERSKPYVLMFGLYTFTAFSLNNVPMMNPLIVNAFILAAGIVALVGVINFFYKISAHSISAASAVAWLVYLFYATGFNTVYFLIVGVLILGLVMTSRLILEAHTSSEVWLGAILGSVSILPFWFF